MRFYGSLSSGDGNAGWEWSRSKLLAVIVAKKTKRGDVHMPVAEKRRNRTRGKRWRWKRETGKKVLKSIVVTRASWLCESRRKYAGNAISWMVLSVYADFLRKNE